MENQTTESILILKDTTANPIPLGLFGLGITTVLINIHFAGFYHISSMILASCIFIGGFALIIAGIMAWKKNKTFETTAFISYGLFWFSFVCIFLIPRTNFAPVPWKNEWATYLFMWGIFTIVMFVGTLKMNRAIQVVFLSLAIMFFLLSLGRYFQINVFVKTGAWAGIICGFSAVYTCLAMVLNEVYEKTILPLCYVKK